jgi:hypothetical protein
MKARFVLLRVLLFAASISMIGTLFVPSIFVYLLVGGVPQGGVASLWDISPLLSSLTALLVAVLTVFGVMRPAEELRCHLLAIGGGLLLASFSAVAWDFSSLAFFGFHPFAIFGVFCSALMLVGAAFLAGRSKKSRGFQFGLQAVFIWITFAALFCAFIRVATSQSKCSSRAPGSMARWMSSSVSSNFRFLGLEFAGDCDDRNRLRVYRPHPVGSKYWADLQLASGMEVSQYNWIFGHDSV